MRLDNGNMGGLGGGGRCEIREWKVGDRKRLSNHKDLEEKWK